MSAARRRGFTLVELMVVLAMTGVLSALALFQHAIAVEESRVDLAAAELENLWSAQAMYWLEHREYAAALDDLLALGVLDRALPQQSGPFRFTIESASEWAFRAEAERIGSAHWSGLLAVEEDGTVGGFVENSEGRRVEPSLP